MPIAVSKQSQRKSVNESPDGISVVRIAKATITQALNAPCQYSFHGSRPVAARVSIATTKSGMVCPSTTLRVAVPPMTAADMANAAGRQ